MAGAAEAPTDTNPKAAATETLIVREVWCTKGLRSAS